MRLLILKATPHKKRGGRRSKLAGPGNNGTILIATNGPASRRFSLSLHASLALHSPRSHIRLFNRRAEQDWDVTFFPPHKPLLWDALLAASVVERWGTDEPGEFPRKMRLIRIPAVHGDL